MELRRPAVVVVVDGGRNAHAKILLFWRMAIDAKTMAVIIRADGVFIFVMA